MKSEEELSPPAPDPIQIQEDEESTIKVEETLPLNPQKQVVPFPQRLVMLKNDEEFGRILEKVKEICVEVPLIDAIIQMLKFAKFLKGIMSNKRIRGDIETIALTEECSALFEKNVSPKFTDPGSFYIPCNIGAEFIEKAFSGHSYKYPMGIIEDVPVEVGGIIIPTDFMVAFHFHDLAMSTP
ncbi:uncharacterized protein LOC121999554 [Zingiber officinale]|uniref:uncharacterized protein LOC121999554 n=1 Tax=Zingiber officinale TaxID=94328 RepID=UPI001C4C1EE2|nr:uncharacterized protein LOC121999554 [Zingiber officinale]